MPTKLLKMTGLVFATLLILLFDASAQQTVLAQPGTCDPDAPMQIVWPREPAVGTEDDDTLQQVSADGRYVLFANQIWMTSGPMAFSLYRYDRLTCAVEDVAIGVDGQPVSGDYFPNLGSMSADGRYIAFGGDSILYLRDMELQMTVEVANFYTGFHSLSADGRYLVYWASRDNGDTTEGGVFVYDRLNDSYETVVAFMDRQDPLNPNIYYYFHMVIAGQGRYIAIMSNAPLVAGDTNGFGDVFLYDRDTQTMARITEGYDGGETNGESEHIPDISADGRYVVFGSFASNLVPDDTNGVKDIFLYDRDSDSIERVTVNALGVEANGGSSEWYAGISADGRYVAFDSQATNLLYGIETSSHIYVLDRDTGLLKLVTVTPDGEGGEGGAGPMLSDDGRFVAFMSRATDLAPGNDAGAVRVFLADWQQLPTSLPGVLQPETCDPDASVTVLLRDPDNSESQSIYPHISDDGRYVAYTFRNQISGEWVNIPYRYDRLTCENEIISITGDATPYMTDHTSASVMGLSGDGRYVLFDFDTRDTVLEGLYVQDMDSGTVEKIPAENTHFLSSISRDGRYVLYSVYVSTTSGIPDNPDDRARLFLYDRDTGQSELIYEAVEGVYDVLFFASIADDNNRIVFSTNANLINPDEYIWNLTDVFVYDRGTQALNRITTGSDGSPPYAAHYFPAISANGRYVVYSAWVETADSNGSRDVFVYDALTNTTRLISVAADGSQGNAPSGHEFVSISADGRFIAFSSDATNLIVGETHNTRGVYIYDQLTDDLWRVSVAEGIIGNFDPMLSRDGQWLAYVTGGDLFIVEWQTLIEGGIEEPTPSEPDASPDRNVVTTGESLLTWGAITWAVGYEIQIDDDANFSSPVVSDNRLTETYLTVPDLPEGVYHWRVRAQRSNGAWGGWSVPDSFVVVTP